MVEVAKVLKKVVSKTGGAKKFADLYGVPVNLVLDVIAGRKEPGPIILNSLGLDGSVEQDFPEDVPEVKQKSIRIPTFREIGDETYE